MNFLDASGLTQVLESVKQQDLTLAALIGERADIVQLEYDTDTQSWSSTAKRYDENGVPTTETVPIDVVLVPDGTVPPSGGSGIGLRVYQNGQWQSGVTEMYIGQVGGEPADLSSEALKLYYEP